MYVHRLLHLLYSVWFFSGRSVAVIDQRAEQSLLHRNSWTWWASFFD